MDEPLSATHHPSRIETAQSQVSASKAGPSPPASEGSHEEGQSEATQEAEGQATEGESTPPESSESPTAEATEPDPEGGEAEAQASPTSEGEGESEGIIVEVETEAVEMEPEDGAQEPALQPPPSPKGRQTRAGRQPTKSSTDQGTGLREWLLGLSEWLPLMVSFSLVLAGLTLVFVYLYGPAAAADLQDPLRFQILAGTIGAGWALLAGLGCGYLAAQPPREVAPPRGSRLRQVQKPLGLGLLLAGLLLALVSLALDIETLSPLALGVLLPLVLLVLAGRGVISRRVWPPALLLTLGAELLGPGVWLAGLLLEGAVAQGLAALLLLVGGACLLGGAPSLRQPPDCLYLWVLGGVILAAITSLSLTESGFGEGTLSAGAGGGLLVVGGLLMRRWRLAELAQRSATLALGEAALKARKPVEALTHIDNALGLAARDGVLLQEPRLWSLKGAALAAQRKHRRALVYLGVALELDPTDELVWFERGKLYAGLKRWQGAVECYSRAVGRRHDFLEAWLALGEARLKLNANTEALAAYGQVTRQAPRRIKGWLGLGRAHAALGQVRQAVQAFDTARRIDPEALQPYLAKAQVYYSLKLWEKAQLAYEMVVHLDPEMAEGWRKIAGCHLELHQPQRALFALNSLIDLEPENMEGLLRRAALRYDEGDYGEAISDIHLALDLEADNSQALKLKQLILSRLDSRGRWR